MRKWLKKMREEKNISQQELADFLYISQNYYSNIENGKRQEDMNLSTAAKLADFFDIPLSTIRQHEELLTAKRQKPA